MESKKTVESIEAMEAIQDKANSLFETVFPQINCQKPYIESNILYIPFTWKLSSNGLMAFDETRSLDSFRCRPFQFEESRLVDWIKMKYLTKEPAIYKMEQFLRSYTVKSDPALSF